MSENNFCAVCSEPLNPRSRLTMCENCRAHMGRWRVRPPGHRQRYREALDLRKTRMEVLDSVPRKGTIEIATTERGNVVSILSRRKA